MPDEVYTIGAVISLLATIAGLWSAWRRHVLTRRIIRSLTDEQREAIGLGPKADPSQTTDN